MSDDLIIAALQGSLGEVQRFLDEGANVNCTNLDGLTPLHWAVTYGHLGVVRLLLNGGADVHCKAHFGQTPLHVAANEGRLEVVRLLIDHRADVHCKDRDGLTPLHLAAGGGLLEVVRLLLNIGADVHCKDRVLGQTPLHGAAGCGHLEVVRLLIDHRADVHCKDRHQKTAMEISEERGFREIHDLLTRVSLNVQLQENEEIRRAEVGISVAQSSARDEPALTPAAEETSCSIVNDQESSIKMSGGYQYEFVEEISPEYICSICSYVIKDCVQINECGHLFCKTCLEKSHRSQNKIFCPTCNRTITTSDIMNDSNVRRKIKSYKVHCVNSEYGCGEQREIFDIEKHIAGCQYRPVKCPSGCGKMISKYKIKRHITNECERRLVICEFCKVKVAHINLNSHIEECPMKFVVCPFCGINDIRIQEMNAHIEICPRIIVKCPFHSEGCTDEMERKDIDKHQVKFQLRHLELTSKALKNVRDENEVYKRQLNEAIKHK